MGAILDNQQTMESPSKELNQLLHADQSSSTFREPEPRFLVPLAANAHSPDHHHHTDHMHKKGRRSASGTMKRVVQRLFGSKSRDLHSDDDDKDAPLIPISEGTHGEGKKPRYSTGGLGKTWSAMATASTTLSLLGRHDHRYGDNNKDDQQQQQPQQLFEYTLSEDELGQDGLMEAPPTPITMEGKVGMARLEATIKQHYEQCMRHRVTELPISQAELLQMVNVETTENVRIADKDCRLYLVPFLSSQSKSAFLSRSQPTRLGRNSKLLLVKSRVISRNHCQIFMEGGTAFVVDVASHTGTFVNGQRLSPSGTISSPMRLQCGDILQLGCTLAVDSTYTEEDWSLRSIAFIVLTGFQLREPKKQLQSSQKEHSKDSLLEPAKSTKLYRKALQAMPDGSSTALYVEFGDLLHDNTFGMAMLARRQADGPCYAIRFNNYKMTWEAAIELVGTTRRMYCSVADASETSFHVTEPSEGDSGGRERRIARISVKDKRFIVVTPITEQRSAAIQPPSTSPMTIVTAQRPASPYLSIAPARSQAASPTTSIGSPRSSLLSPRLDTITTHLQDTLIISRPEIPYYCLDLAAGTVVARDRNNQDKERLLGSGASSNGKGVLKWGKRVLVWQGNLAPSRDDMLIVLALLLQQLINMA